MLCVAAGEQAGFDALATNWQVACEIAAEHGREMDRSRLRCVVNMHLAESREQAVADIRYGCEEFVRYFNNNQPRFHVPEGADYVDWVLEHQIAVVGTPADAIARIERLYERQGEFGAILLQVTNWADWRALRHSYELYAEHVIPHFSGANAEPRALLRMGDRPPGRVGHQAGRTRRPRCSRPTRASARPRARHLRFPGPTR